MQKTQIVMLFLYLSQCWCTTAQAQDLEVKDFDQFFIPQINIKTELFNESPLQKGSTETYQHFGIGGNATIPIKGKFDVDLNLNKLKNLKNIKSWKDLSLKNIGKSIPVDVSGHQIFWTVSGGMRQLQLSIDSSGHRAYYGSTGVMGLHLQKNFTMWFYGANLGVSEEPSTFRKWQPQLNAYLAQARVHKYLFLYYYGVFLNYYDGRVLPIPFIGINVGLPPFFSLQATLPFQLKFTYRKNPKLRASIELNWSGFNTGFENRNLLLPNDSPGSTLNRISLRSTYLRFSTTAEYRLTKGRLLMQVGTAFNRQLQFYSQETNHILYKPTIPLYASATFQINLNDRSLIGNIWKKLDFHW